MRQLFVLRPEPGASESARRARDIGLDPVMVPLFRVEPVAWEVPEAACFDALLLTSANAVRHGGEGLQDLRGLPVHAVGEATAQAARDAGFDIASSGSSGADRLLGSIDPGLRLLHLCGEHRRAPKGARQTITAIPVYRSAELPPPGRLKALDGQTAAVHSARAGARLAELADQLALDRSAIRLACISADSAEAAGDGWERKEAAEQPSDEALLALAARLCDKPRA